MKAIMHHKEQPMPGHEVYAEGTITAPYAQSSKARLFLLPLPPLYALVTTRSVPPSPYEGERERDC